MEAAEFQKVFPALSQRVGQRNAAFLMTIMRERDVPTGSVLIEDHAPVSSLFLVVSGEFRVEISSEGKSLEIGCLRSGKWLGEISLFSDQGISTSRVVATQASRVLELKHADFHAARAEHPDLVSALTKELVDTMAERVRSTDKLLARGASGEPTARPADMESGARRSWIRAMLQGLTGAEG
jgi:CRP-like cAMP-binding protein